LILECGCLEQYWDMITPQRMDELEAMLLEAHRSEQSDALIHWADNTRFHLALISYFNNPYIYNALQSSLGTLSRAYAQFYWDKWHTTKFVSSNDWHKKIVEYLRSNDKNSALLCLKSDIGCFEDI
ncbi:MAG: FCD domain-containing protein, partial [Angelakisella sp.]